MICIVSGRAMNEAHSQRKLKMIVRDVNFTETVRDELAEVVPLTTLKGLVPFSRRPADFRCTLPQTWTTGHKPRSEDPKNPLQTEGVRTND
jgi:hypothetical protein